MSSRFGSSSLHQRPDPRNALFKNYQPISRASENTPKTPMLYGSYGVSDFKTQSDRDNIGYRGNNFSSQSSGSRSGSALGFRASTPNERGQYSDAVLSSLESQNDSEVESIIGKVRQLKSMTIAIGDEIRSSSALAEKMNERFEGTRLRLRGTMSRMLVMAHKTGVGWKAWLIFFTFVVLLFWWVRFFR